jgi:peroxiredoxin Q/BCP
MKLFPGATPAVDQGDEAPDFDLADQNGERVRLSAFRGDKNVVLYFYPRDDTPGCTVEACTFRDHIEQFSAAGAVVLGVSSDSESAHRRFADKHRLPFTLLVDEGGHVRTSYGVRKTLGLFDGRVTFVIDKHGIVRHVFSSQAQFKRHVDEALAALQLL